MRTKFILVLAVFFTQALSLTAQLPKEYAATDVFSIYNKSKNINLTANLLQYTPGNFNVLASNKILPVINQFLANNSTANCTELSSTLGPLAPAALNCNGYSVTPISFNIASRTVVPGAVADKNEGVAYRYTNAGTAPDGTMLDALVTVVDYNNNNDDSPTIFRAADIFTVAGTNYGYDANLQPSIEQENESFINNNPWQGSIRYKIQFVRTGTTTPKVISVVATTIDNDGSGKCGGLKETVIYSANNQIIKSASPNQVISGNSVTGPSVVQAGIGIGEDYASASLFVNVSEIEWTYSFATVSGCAGQASEDRFGSLNMSCRFPTTQAINFGTNFTTVAVGGNVYNDVNGLNDTPAGIVNGTGTNAGGLFANLVNRSLADNKDYVVQSVAMAANGTYSFSGVALGNYTVQISTNQGVAENEAPAITLPSGWTNTGEHLGAGAGSDGTVDGALPIAITSAAITNANFGIEQRPVANTNTAANQTNPGGTNSAAIPAATFSASDPAPGNVENIRITGFPTNATTITINGTQYTGANFPAGGVTVPTNTSGNPTQPILVDPIDGATTVAIPFVAIDNARVVSSLAATANIPFVLVSLSGTVLNDVNGLTDNIVNGTGTNTGGSLYVNLLNSGNVVVQSLLLPASGVYSFSSVNAGSYTVQVSTTQGTVGNAAPARVMPSGWVNTGEFVGIVAGNDGSANGLLPVSIVSASVSNANFGIEQRPTSNDNTTTSQTNPGGTNSVTVPAATFTGNDESGGVVSSIRITAFPSNATSLTVETTTYYPNTAAIPGICPTSVCAAFPTNGVTIPKTPAQTIKVDPIDGAVTVAILFVVIDNANVESTATATATVPFATVAIGGTVFDDVNGLTDNTVNGMVPNTGTTLRANLLDNNGIVLQSVIIPTITGVYSFANLNSGNYTVQISTNPGTVGSAMPITALPSSWVNTGEFIGTGTGNDGAVNGLLPISVAAVSIANANFGIEQRPVANNNTAESQNNPGGTNNATVPPSVFTATDSASVTNLRITEFPSNATTIIINGTEYTAGNFPAGGVTIPTNAAGNPLQEILIDPVEGVVTIVIRYVAIDNAGVVSSDNASAAMANVPFVLVPTAANGEISGVLSFGRNPIPNALVVLHDTNSNSKVFTRTDSDGKYFFTEKAVGETYVIQPLSSKYVFSSANRLINLFDNATDVNFESSTKTYRPKNDFDGDGKSDLAVFRPSDGNWYVLKSSDEQMSVFNFGFGTDIPVSADFDGDGKTDYAVFRPSEGNWYIWQSKTQSLRVEKFGLSDDKLIPSDYDGDGKADIAVYRNGFWYIRRSSDDLVESKNFGLSIDIPVTQDFDGDGETDLSLYRPSDGTWYSLLSLNNNFSAEKFGLAKDAPVSGDFDGDGFADIAQFRKGYWYILNSTTSFEASQFGSGKDKSIVGDYDGDGRADLTVYHNGFWLVRNSGDGTVRKVYFGLSTDTLVE